MEKNNFRLTGTSDEHSTVSKSPFSPQIACAIKCSLSVVIYWWYHYQEITITSRSALNFALYNIMEFF